MRQTSSHMDDTCSILDNRHGMNDRIPDTRIEGKVAVGGSDIYSGEVHVETLGKKIGMVFQQPNLFPKSIYDHVTFGPKQHGSPLYLQA